MSIRDRIGLADLQGSLAHVGLPKSSLGLKGQAATSSNLAEGKSYGATQIRNAANVASNRSFTWTRPHGPSATRAHADATSTFTNCGVTKAQSEKPLNDQCKRALPAAQTFLLLSHLLLTHLRRRASGSRTGAHTVSGELSKPN